MITFDGIRDIHRVEESSKILTKLPESFVSDVSDYLKEKSGNEADKAINSLQSIFNIRMMKIFEMACIKIKPENMVEEESEMFGEIASVIEKNENWFLQDSDTSEFEVLEDLPAFLGPDMKTYTLKKGQIIVKNTLPTTLNYFLIKKGILKKRL